MPFHVKCTFWAISGKEDSTHLSFRKEKPKGKEKNIKTMLLQGAFTYIVYEIDH
jgi:hypothetical protein